MGKGSELVFVLHGLGANRLVMALLASRIARRGYHVRNYGYMSFLWDVQYHAARLSKQLAKADADPAVTRIHIVAHSMGGIVARQALLDGVPRKFGRMVMIAPPNRGSRVGTFFNATIGAVCAAIRQLSTLPTSYVNQLPPPKGIEIGIIAGLYDLLVGPGCTYLDGMSDHVTFPYMHTSLVFRRDVADEVVQFLDNGRFRTRPERGLKNRATREPSVAQQESA